MVPTDDDRQHLASFLDATIDRPMLGLVYGRRRIGKSTLLVEETRSRGGFYFEATRVASPVQLRRLGVAIGAHLGVGPLALASWEEAIEQLLALGADGVTPVVLDEFGHILQADPSVDSVIASVLGPGARDRVHGQARLVLCGSAIAMMRALTAGEAPLRGRAGLELVMQADDFRRAATRLHDPGDLALAGSVFATIGGVVGYATDMVAFDLPDGPDDFPRWVCDRLLSPASPLHHEATTLLAEDPTLAGSSDLMHHAILGAIANGAVTAGSIATSVGRQVSNLAPALGRLVDAGFVVRHVDPIRKQRPLYALGDPYLQFHYAVLEPHRSVLRTRDRQTVWHDRLVDTFSSRVRGPVFEEQARTWVAAFASASTVGGPIDHVGPSSVSVEGVDRQLDVVVATGDQAPADRTILAIGEAKAGERLTLRHVHRLRVARGAFGARADGAKMLLFGSSFDDEVRSLVDPDLELVDLERLHHGS